MLKSKARQRNIAAKSAVAGALGGGALLLAGFVMVASANADQRSVSYACTPAGAIAASPAVTPLFNVNLNAVNVTPTASQAVPLTWSNGQPAATPWLAAPNAVPTGDKVVIEGEILVAPPSATATVTVKATSTHTVLTSPVPQNSPLPLPTMSATVTPTVTGTTIARAGKFTVKVAGTGTTPTTLYDCVVATSGVNTQQASVELRVGTASASPTGSNTSTPSPTRSTTPRPTTTVTEYETVSPKETTEATPKGGADTGGGGSVGPDGRTFILVGSVTVLAAGAAGLLLRRRGVGGR
ncbi:hypothetical protein [Sinosporangium siamense]|uniref:hypothetical protein n=1 Tax=Sinosporangium siamense TaxID=1367973 RepID=UPI00194E4620|nr:hypothetical protein [Sinosporangium siamense]